MGLIFFADGCPKCIVHVEASKSRAWFIGHFSGNIQINMKMPIQSEKLKISNQVVSWSFEKDAIEKRLNVESVGWSKTL